MAEKDEVLARAEQLESRVKELDNLTVMSRKKVTQAKKSLQAERLSLILAPLLALLLTSSCSLHAWELSGGPTIIELLNLWEGAVNGLAEKLGVLWAPATLVTSLVLRILSIPAMILIMPVGVLRIIHALLQMTFPQAERLLLYAELAVVLFAVITALRPAHPIADSRAARKELRAARAELRDRVAQQREAKTKLASVTGTEEYQTAQRQWQKRVGSARVELARIIPKDVPVSRLDDYLSRDPEKTVETAKLIDESMEGHVIDLELSSTRDIGDKENVYLSLFKMIFDEDMKWIQATRERVGRQLHPRTAEQLEAELKELLRAQEAEVAKELQEEERAREAEEARRSEGAGHDSDSGTFHGKHARR